jgi:hypothetical protein
MSKKFDQDCLERLLPDEANDSSHNQDSTQLTNQQLLTVNENERSLANTENLKKNKFTVIKYNDAENLKTQVPSSPTNSNRYRDKSTWNFDDEDPLKNSKNSDAENIELQALNILDKSNEFINEEEDLFCGDLIKEFQGQNSNGREMEGQDTITSLSNDFYKKTLNRIKRKSVGGLSNKSNTSTNSLTNIGNEKDSNQNPSVSNSDATSLTEKVGLFKSLFQNNDSLATSLKSSLRFDGSRNSVKMRANSHGDLNKSILDLVNRISHKEDTLTENVTVKAASRNELTNSDLVFDALSKAIHSSDHKLVDTQFVEKVVTAVKMQHLDQQRKRDKARKVCLVAQITVFVFVFIMAFFMATSVINILNIIQMKTNGNNATLLFNEISHIFSNNLEDIASNSTDNEIIGNSGLF